MKYKITYTEFTVNETGEKNIILYNEWEDDNRFYFDVIRSGFNELLINCHSDYPIKFKSYVEDNYKGTPNFREIGLVTETFFGDKVYKTYKLVTIEKLEN